jgi:erythromycin esterase
MSNGVTLGQLFPQPSQEISKTFQSIAHSHKILALGETVHTSGGYYNAKIALLKDLISSGAITAVAFENPWSETKVVSDFINGKDVSIQAVASRLFSVWRSKDVMNFLEWLRYFNSEQPTEKRIRFYGFDVQKPESSLETVGQYIKQHGIESAKALDPLNGSHLLRVGESSTLPGWTAIKKLFDQNESSGISDDVDLIIEKLDFIENHRRSHSSKDFDLKLSLIALSYYVRFIYHFAKEAYETGVAAPSTEKPMPTIGFNFRDLGMAELFSAFHEALGEPHTCLWAHNLHIVIDGESIPAWRKKSLGSHLNQRYRQDYFPVALAGYYVKTNWPGAPGNMEPPLPHPENSIEHVLHSKKFEQCYVDLSSTDLFSNNQTYILNPVLEMNDISRHFKGLIYLRESQGMELFEA